MSQAEPAQLGLPVEAAYQVRLLGPLTVQLRVAGQVDYDVRLAALDHQLGPELLAQALRRGLDAMRQAGQLPSAPIVAGVELTAMAITGPRQPG